MFPTCGYFSAVPCPFFLSGLCERSFCHFKHSKTDIEKRKDAVSCPFRGETTRVTGQPVFVSEGESSYYTCKLKNSTAPFNLPPTCDSDAGNIPSFTADKAICRLPVTTMEHVATGSVMRVSSNSASTDVPFGYHPTPINQCMPNDFPEEGGIDFPAYLPTPKIKLKRHHAVDIKSDVKRRCDSEYDPVNNYACNGLVNSGSVPSVSEKHVSFQKVADSVSGDIKKVGSLQFGDEVLGRSSDGEKEIPNPVFEAKFSDDDNKEDVLVLTPCRSDETQSKCDGDLSNFEDVGDSDISSEGELIDVPDLALSKTDIMNLKMTLLWNEVSTQLHVSAKTEKQTVCVKDENGSLSRRTVKKMIYKRRKKGIENEQLNSCSVVALKNSSLDVPCCKETKCHHLPSGITSRSVSCKTRHCSSSIEKNERCRPNLTIHPANSADNSCFLECTTKSSSVNSAAGKDNSHNNKTDASINVKEKIDCQILERKSIIHRKTNNIESIERNLSAISSKSCTKTSDGNSIECDGTGNPVLCTGSSLIRRNDTHKKSGNFSLRKVKPSSHSGGKNAHTSCISGKHGLDKSSQPFHLGDEDSNTLVISMHNANCEEQPTFHSNVVSSLDTSVSLVPSRKRLDFKGVRCSTGSLDHQKGVRCSTGSLDHHKGVRCSTGSLDHHKGVRCSTGSLDHQKHSSTRSLLSGLDGHMFCLSKPSCPKVKRSSSHSKQLLRDLAEDAGIMADETIIDLTSSPLTGTQSPRRTVNCCRNETTPILSCVKSNVSSLSVPSLPSSSSSSSSVIPISPSQCENNSSCTHSVGTTQSLNDCHLSNSGKKQLKHFSCNGLVYEHIEKDAVINVDNDPHESGGFMESYSCSSTVSGGNPTKSLFHSADMTRHTNRFSSQPGKSSCKTKFLLSESTLSEFHHDLLSPQSIEVSTHLTSSPSCVASIHGAVVLANSSKSCCYKRSLSSSVMSSGHHQHSELTSVKSSGHHQHSELTSVKSSGHHKLSELTSVRSNGHHQRSELTSVKSSGYHQHSELNSVKSSGHHQHSELTSVKSSGHHKLSELTSVRSSGHHQLSELTSIKSSGHHQQSDLTSVKSSGHHKHSELTSVKSSGHDKLSELTSVKSSGHHQHSELTSVKSSGHHQHSELTSAKSSGHHKHSELISIKSSGHHQHPELTSVESSGHHQHLGLTSVKSSSHHKHSELTSVKSSSHHQLSELTSVKSSGHHQQSELTSVKSSGHHKHSELTSVKSSSHHQLSELTSVKSSGHHQQSELTSVKSSSHHKHSELTSVKSSSHHQLSELTSVKSSGHHQQSELTSVKSSGHHQHSELNSVRSSGLNNKSHSHHKDSSLHSVDSNIKHKYSGFNMAESFNQHKCSLVNSSKLNRNEISSALNVENSGCTKKCSMSIIANTPSSNHRSSSSKSSISISPSKSLLSNSFKLTKLNKMQLSNVEKTMDNHMIMSSLPSSVSGCRGSLHVDKRSKHKYDSSSDSCERENNEKGFLKVKGGKIAGQCLENDDTIYTTAPTLADIGYPVPSSDVLVMSHGQLDACIQTDGKKADSRQSGQSKASRDNHGHSINSKKIFNTVNEICVKQEPSIHAYHAVSQKKNTSTFGSFQSCRDTKRICMDVAMSADKSENIDRCGSDITPSTKFGIGRRKDRCCNSTNSTPEMTTNISYCSLKTAGVESTLNIMKHSGCATGGDTRKTDGKKADSRQSGQSKASRDNHGHSINSKKIFNTVNEICVKQEPSIDLDEEISEHEAKIDDIEYIMESEDESTVDECWQIFDDSLDEQEASCKSQSFPKLGSKVMERVAGENACSSVRRRVAHKGTTDLTCRSEEENVKRRHILNPAEVMHNRFLDMQKRALRILKNKSMQESQVVSIRRPVIPSTFGSKVPINMRQRYLNLIIDECLKLSADVEAAYQRALSVESDVYDRAVNANIYLRVAVNAITRLRSEAKRSQVACSVSDPKTSSLAQSCQAEPRGSKASMTSFTVQRSLGCYKKSDVALTAGQLYRRMLTYCLTEKQLVDNGYPRPHPHTAGEAIISDNKYTSSDRLLKSNERTCARCGKRYMVNDTGLQTFPGDCVYHWSRAYPRKKNGVIQPVYNCCGADQGSEGCQIANNHVYQQDKQVDIFGYTNAVPRSTPKDGNYNTYALDCEMVYTTGGLELARVTVVNVEGETIYESFVRPSNPVVDHNTRFSGLTEHNLKGVRTTLTDVQAILLSVLSAQSILIGHSLESDLVTLKLIHSKVVDTAVVFPHRLGPPYKRALKNLMLETFQKIIQADDQGHDSREDAVACLQLMKWKIREDSKN